VDAWGVATRNECPRTYVRKYMQEEVGGEGREAADDRRDEVVCFASVQKGVAGDDRLCGSSHVRRPPLRGGEYGW
jgi:hypothetical protein